MNAERLIEHYDQICEAPDAVSRLRRFVLDLAVRGKLVEQDPEEESASVLLERIADAKARLIKDGHIKETQARAPSMLEAPHDLPQNWSWTALGTVMRYDAGTKHNPTSLDSSKWLLELEDVEKDTGRLVARIMAGERSPRSAKSEFIVGDILYGKLRPYLNKVLVADESGYSTTEIVAIRPFMALCPEYCALALRRPDFVDYVTRLGQGTKMPRLRTQDAVVAPFPLPPLAEQRRIVAKVDELMALCDRLEETHNTRDSTRDQLTTASFARLSAPETDQQAFQSQARFALETLPALTARPDQIKTLRQTILDLAVRGKLVEQDSADESASELLERISAEKLRLVNAGKIRNAKPSRKLNKEEIPFDLPASWTWVQIADIGSISPRNDAPDDQPASFVPMPMISSKYGVKNQHEPRAWCEIKKGYSHFAEGDVGLAKITPCFENGKSTVFRNLTGEIGAGTTELHVLRPLIVSAEYILLFLKTPLFIETGISKMTGTAGQKRVPKDYFAHSPFPLPPLAEQRRIVSKVDELMALCDQLETRLAKVKTTRSRLLESMLREALAPVIQEPAPA